MTERAAAPASGASLRTTAALLALAAIGVLAPLARAWLAGLTVLHRDQTGQFAPLRWLAGTALREGRLPLWNPYCATGMPYLAETTHGALHPLSVAAAFLFPGDGLDPLVGAWVISAGVGAYSLARTVGVSASAGLVAAFGYGLSGWTLSMTSNLVGLAGAGSAPWVLVGLRVAGRDRGPLGFAAGAAGVAAGALAGDVQALAVATAAGLALAIEGGDWRGGLRALGAVAVGALLAGIQLAPSWSFLQQTDRAYALAAEEKDQWDLAPWRLVEAISPGFFTLPSDGMGPAPVYLALGNPTAHELPMAESVFLGGALLLLAAAGARASRTAWVLLGGTAVVTWFAMGKNLGARALQDLVPVAAHWRYGEKYLTTAVLGLAVLAALGTDRLVADAGRARRWAWAAGWGAAATLAVWLAIAAGDAGKGAGVAVASAIRAQLLLGLPHALAALLCAAGCLAVAARGRTALARAGLVITVWGAGVAASPFALRPGSPAARLGAEPPPVLESVAPGPRVLRMGGVQGLAPRPGWNAIDQHNFEVAVTHAPNFNARHRVDAFGADTGLMPLRWRSLVDALGPLLPQAARRYAVTHLAVPVGSLPVGARPVVNDPRTGMAFAAIPHRAWASFPEEVVAVDGPERAIEAVVAFTRQGRRAAVVEAQGAFATAPGRVIGLVRERERLEIEAEALAEAVLVVNDAFWPGWRAFLDGVEVPVFRADALVRAVRWPAGRHTLVMQYQPEELRLGLGLTLAGLGLLGAACLLLWWRREAAPAAAADQAWPTPAGERGAQDLLTVVIPVWNEAENLAAWWRNAVGRLPPGTRVLAVHDTDDDDTLPVIRELAAGGAPVLPLRSSAPGFPGALMTGLLAAERGPVLVTMADGSDDLEALPRMLEAYRAGADVVVGSRFMPGGSQAGAHPFKAALGRWGSLALHRVAGFPVRDVSNAFRLYDAALVRRLRIDAATGFEVVPALLFAAWRSGARIVEVPASWRRRQRGRSRFRFRWLPRYGLLWLRALLHGVRAGGRRRE